MDQVDEIKQKTDIAVLVGGYVQLKNAGRNLKGLCPFHEEKTPSFMVNEELQIYKCFGCGKGGDVYKFLMEVEGLDFREALEKLADRAGVKLENNMEDHEKSEKAKLLDVHAVACEYFHYLLMKHRAGAEAKKYLEKRGIGEKIMETFRLGYALESWDGLLTYLTTKKKFERGLLVRSGLVIESQKGGYDRFRGRVMIPLMDGNERVVGFSGRVLPSKAMDTDAKYINSPETEIYHKSRMLYGLSISRQEIRKKDRVLVVEGDFDMISSYIAGITETVAIKGSALTTEMLTILSKLTKNIILALDADKAGEAAIKRSVAEAEKLGFAVKVVNIEGGKDPDEVARKSASEWKRQVDAAVEVYDFVMQRSLAKWGSEGPEALRKVTEEVLPYFSKISNSVVQAYWIAKLAKKLRTNEQKMWEEMGKRERVEIVGGQVDEVVMAEKQSRLTTIGYQLVSLMYRADDEDLKMITKKLAGLPLPGAVGKLIVSITENGKVGNVAEFIQGVPAELKETASFVFMQGGEEEADERSLQKVLGEFVREVVKQEQMRIGEEIKKREGLKDKAGVKRLSQEYAQLSRRKID